MDIFELLIDTIAYFNFPWWMEGALVYMGTIMLSCVFLYAFVFVLASPLFILSFASNFFKRYIYVRSRRE